MKVLNLLNHPKVYLYTMILLVIGMSLSKFLVGMAAIILPSRWIFGCIMDRNFLAQLKKFWANKAAVIIFSLYVMHLLGLLYTTDFAYAANDLRIKLPLVSLPIVFATMPKLTKKDFYTLLWFFILAALVGSLHSIGVLNGWIGDTEIRDMRDIIVFVSHIRFALFVCMSIFMLVWFALKRTGWVRIVSIVMALWFIVYLYILGSPTGMLVLLGGTIVIFVYWSWISKSNIIKAISTLLVIGLPLGAFLYVRGEVKDYYNTVEVDFANLPEKTAGGEPYHHDPENRQIENGHYVWINIAWNELKRSWNQRSDVGYDSLDHSGQLLSGTLIRYLTSRGLYKDSVGVYALNEHDISNIENGVANFNAENRYGIQKRLDQIIFEFNVYFNGGDPSGNSITQKLEFWKAAREIILNNFWIGVGTGDVQMAFDETYDAMNSPLQEHVRLRAHNQYLTMFVTFGVIGFIWFILALLLPPLMLRKQYDYYYVIFFICAILSFLSEDTLETQAGLTFFAFFNCLFLFARTEEDEEQRLVPETRERITNT